MGRTKRKRERTREERELANRILWLVENRDPTVSQNEWAKRMGFFPTVFSDIRDGGMPSAGALVKIPRIFDVDGHWLLTGEGHWAKRSGTPDRSFVAGSITVLSELEDWAHQRRALYEGKMSEAEMAKAAAEKAAGLVAPSRRRA